ncbi:MAG: hypothetical protein IJD16_07980 [Desulfovibrio sp.]|nr:hypothetical protein [Desulfovibrio sp.]
MQHSNDTDMPLPGFMPDTEAQAGPEAVIQPQQGNGEEQGANTAGEKPEPLQADPAQDEARWQARLREHEAGQRRQWEAQVAAWREEAARDPQLGGQNLEASVARAQLALSRFDTDRSIGRLLEQSGYGNHPAVLRFFNRLADALMEDSPAMGQGVEALAPLEDRMYAGWSSLNV